MKFSPIYLNTEESQKLLTTKNGDAALLYLFLRNGNSLQEAKAQLRFSNEQLANTLSILHNLNMYQPAAPVHTPEKPSYSEKDILQTVHENNDFQDITNEVQYRLGKILNTEELKILLGITNYLGLSHDVICALVNYCINCYRKKGYLKTPSIYQIEKEAYRWADAGIETLEDALEYTRRKDEEDQRLSKLMQLLQIRGRDLTPPEKKMATEWLQMGLSDDLIQMAYEKTCIKTGGMNWAYMNKILTSWKNEGCHSPADVKKRRYRQSAPTGATGPSEDELEAIRQMMEMSTDEFLGLNGVK